MSAEEKGWRYWVAEDIYPCGRQLFRFEDRLVSGGLDEFDNPVGPPRINVYLKRYNVIKRTHCGAWVDLGLGDKRFVNLTARKKFACVTVEAALESFQARKDRQCGILSSRLQRAKDAKRIAERMAEDERRRRDGSGEDNDVEDQRWEVTQDRDGCRWPRLR